MVLLTALIVCLGYFILSGPAAPEPLARHATIGFLLLFFLFVQFEFIEKFYNHFLYLIIVTDRRIHRVKKTLFITDDQQSIDLWVLQDINKSQHGLVQNILGFGSLILEAQETTLRLHFIPGVGKKYQQLMHIRERMRQRPPTPPTT